MSEYNGRIISSLGGAYTVLSNGKHFRCYAKGTFRHEKINPLVGDYVRFELDAEENDGKEDDGYIISVEKRKNELLRPPMANIDRLFIVSAFESPAPLFLNIDKLTVLCEHAGIDAVIVFNKSDLARDCDAEKYKKLYSQAGFETFALRSDERDEVRRALLPLTAGITSAFAGASGVGKSSIINSLFPELMLETGSVSKKTQRGRHTTRAVSLYELDNGGFLADTPGFSFLDFEKFFFMQKEDLAPAFREFNGLLGTCRYTKCTHTKEEGCAVIEKVLSGSIPSSRHESYVSLYDALKQHKDWEK